VKDNQSQKAIFMKSMTKKFATIAHWAVTALFCVSVFSFAWQGEFFSSTTAMAAPNALVIASTSTGEEVKRENKSFVQDAAEKVKETANKNADRVEQATDDDDSFIEGKAKRDAARIEKRANEDAARTQEAIEDNVNAIERTIDNIKDAFSN